MKKSTAAGLYVVLFFIFCLLPSICMPFYRGMPFYKGQLAENRNVSVWPALVTEEGNLNWDFFDEVQAYVAEHFAFRSELVAADSMLKYKLLHTPCDDQVVIGKEGWLFFDDTLLDYAGVLLTDSELDAIAEKMSAVCGYIRSKGKEPLFVIVPNKNSIYPEYMPSYFGNRSETCNLTLLQERLEALGVPFVDAYHILLAGKQEGELYLHKDTHWNNKGARLVLNEIYAAYGLPEQYELTEYTLEENHKPDLYGILFPEGGYLEAQPVYDDGKTFAYVGRLHSLDDIMIRTKASSGNGKSILVYRDSFGRAMIPYMGESFDSAVFHRSTPYDLSVMENVECDYVLIEIVERNLRDLGEIGIP